MPTPEVTTKAALGKIEQSKAIANIYALKL
jgi:hypothetical protein